MMALQLDDGVTITYSYSEYSNYNNINHSNTYTSVMPFIYNLKMECI